MPIDEVTVPVEEAAMSEERPMSYVKPTHAKSTSESHVSKVSAANVHCAHVAEAAVTAASVAAASMTAAGIRLGRRDCQHCRKRRDQ